MSTLTNGQDAGERTVEHEDVQKLFKLRGEGEGINRYWAMYRRGNPSPQGIFDDPVFAEEVCLLLDMLEHARRAHPEMARKILAGENIFAIIEKQVNEQEKRFTITELFQPPP